MVIYMIPLAALGVSAIFSVALAALAVATARPTWMVLILVFLGVIELAIFIYWVFDLFGKYVMELLRRHDDMRDSTALRSWTTEDVKQADSSNMTEVEIEVDRKLYDDLAKIAKGQGISVDELASKVVADSVKDEPVFDRAKKPLSS